MSVWRTGAQVTLDFNTGLKDVKNLGASHAMNADVMSRPWPGALRFRLGKEPDASNGFSIVTHGGAIHEMPAIT